jgi:hypothetical protein
VGRFERLNRPPAPHLDLLEQVKRDYRQESQVSPSKSDKENLDRWHRNQGKTKPPKRPTGAPEGNKNRLKHGIFADRCLTPEEKQMFDVLIERLHQDFQFNKSSDFIQVELVGVYSVKLVRAQMEGNTQAAESLDRMIRCHMKDLKTTKVAREGEEPKGPQTSPAEWASTLLDKVSEMATPKKATRKKPKKSSDNTAAAKKRPPKTQAVTEGPHE